MQSFFNFLALSSFIASTAVLGGGAYLYIHADEFIDNIMTDLVQDILPKLTVDALIPDVGGLGTAVGGDLLPQVPSPPLMPSIGVPMGTPFN